MRFEFVDRVLERGPGSIVTVKRVSLAEEYLQDHFPTFPVLPGVLMLESMVQAARALVDPTGAIRAGDRAVDRMGGRPLVLGSVRAFKYARFVPPGWSLVCHVEVEAGPGMGPGMGPGGPVGVMECRGRAYAVEGDLTGWSGAPVASSGRFTLRPAAILSVSPLGA